MAEATDVLMIIVNKSNRLSGEGTTSFVTSGSSSLTSDFHAPVFELKEFSFAVGAAASLNAGATDKAAADQAAAAADAAAKGKPAPVAKAPPVQKAKDGQADVIDMQPIEYTRLFDAASTQLLTALVKCETLDSISIVKRKAAGTDSAGEAYLRLDFTEVLMIGLEWKDADDLVEETGTFIYRKLKVSYRPQKADGTLDATKQISWSMKA